MVKIEEIPVNQYVPDFDTEVHTYGKDGLKHMYLDMLLIREFESMLNAIKTQGAYEGIAYTHKGPAHLSMGQESAAVGQSAVLDTDDFLFGSHRSHGEILAKCFSAVHTLDEDALLDVMQSFLDGACLKVVEQGHQGSVKDLATDYVLYGTLAETFAREYGFNKGLGGSMHAFFPPFGSMPNNAIVGGSGDICSGRRCSNGLTASRGL